MGPVWATSTSSQRTAIISSSSEWILESRRCCRGQGRSLVVTVKYKRSEINALNCLHKRSVAKTEIPFGSKGSKPYSLWKKDIFWKLRPRFKLHLNSKDFICLRAAGQEECKTCKGNISFSSLCDITKGWFSKWTHFLAAVKDRRFCNVHTYSVCKASYSPRSSWSQVQLT